MFGKLNAFWKIMSSGCDVRFLPFNVVLLTLVAGKTKGIPVQALRVPGGEAPRIQDNI
jgi:hypothetical protein